jgi:Domain of unknown function (DUF5668)
MNFLIRALTGPILLTTLGVLLSMDYLGSVTFGRTWPVLLIVFGLCKVLEYTGSQGTPQA